MAVDPLNAWRLIAQHHEEREKESAERWGALWLSALLREMQEDLPACVAVLSELPYERRRELCGLVTAMTNERKKRGKK